MIIIAINLSDRCFAYEDLLFKGLLGESKRRKLRKRKEKKRKVDIV